MWLKLRRKFLIQLDTRKNHLIRFSRLLTSIPSMRRHSLVFRSAYQDAAFFTELYLISFPFLSLPLSAEHENSLPVHCVEWSKTEKSQRYEDINQRQAFDTATAERIIIFGWDPSSTVLRQKGWNCVKEAAKPKHQFMLPHRSHRKQCVCVSSGIK